MLIAMDREVTLGSDAYERTERRLEEWAAERERVTGKLGIPVLSSMSVMIDYLHREVEPDEIVRSSAPKKAATKKKRQQRQYSASRCRNPACGHIYAAAKCPRCAQPRLELTARGNASSSQRPSDMVGFTATVAQIDSIVATLPGRYKAAIFRGYMYRQPDRIAARELDMPRERFTHIRERAVIQIAEKLAERRDGAYIPAAQPSGW